MVEVARIGVLRCPVVACGHWTEDAPRSWSEKKFARHRREGIDNGARAYLGRKAQLLCVPMPGLFGRSDHLNVSKPKAARDRLLTNRDAPSTRLNAGGETVSGRAPNLAGQKIFFDCMAKSYFVIGISKGHLEESHRKGT